MLVKGEFSCGILFVNILVLSKQIVPNATLLDDHHLKVAETFWKNLTNETETPPIPSHHNNWDMSMVSKTFGNLE
ncbi:hypothetical protein Bhyg_01157, partial [Pseudolycoriella hygida]